MLDQQGRVLAVQILTRPAAIMSDVQRSPQLLQTSDGNVAWSSPAAFFALT